MRDSSLKQYDLLSVDLGWTGRDLTGVALSFLDFKNKKIFCTYTPYLSLKEFLSLIEKNLKPECYILLDIPLKGKVQGFFRPLERTMQKAGLPCRPSRDALIKGSRLLSRIEALGFKAIEIYPYELYKFYCLLVESEVSKKSLTFWSKRFIDPTVFRRFFPPYKRRAEDGIENAERVIKKLLRILNLNLIANHSLHMRSPNSRRLFGAEWDIYDSIFGAIAGYLLLKGSPCARFVRDKTGSEILILSDENLKNLLDSYSNKSCSQD